MIEQKTYDIVKNSFDGKWYVGSYNERDGFIPIGNGYKEKRYAYIAMKRFERDHEVLTELSSIGTCDFCKKTCFQFVQVLDDKACPKCASKWKRIQKREHKNFWCTCGKTNFTDVTFIDNNECFCDVQKHHYHCNSCGGIIQIG